MTLEELIQRHPERCATITQKPPVVEFESLPPFKLPAIEDLHRLERKFGCSFPSSFVQLQIQYGNRIPVPEGFGWAIANIPPFFCVASLEMILQAAYVSRKISTEYVPFCEDEENFYCFDHQASDKTGECPIVFWDHDEGAILNAPHKHWLSLCMLAGGLL